MPAQAATATSRLSLLLARYAGPVSSSSQEPGLLPGWVKDSPVVGVMSSSVAVVMVITWVVVVMGGASGVAVVTTITWWVVVALGCWPSWAGDDGGRSVVVS